MFFDCLRATFKLTDQQLFFVSRRVSCVEAVYFIMMEITAMQFLCKVVS